jgi:hypothetical protein
MKTSLILALLVVVVLPCCTTDQRATAFSAGLQAGSAALTAHKTGRSPQLAAAGAALGALTSAKATQHVIP